MHTEGGGLAGEDPRDPEIDALFAQIVAHWADPAASDDPEAPPRPEEEAATPRETPPTAGETPPVTGETPPTAGDGPPAPPPMILSIPVWRAPTGPSLEEDLLDEDADVTYTPEPVDLPPGEDVHYWGAVVGLVLGPLLVLYVALARPFHGTLWLLAGLGLLVGGFALLVLRGPRDRDPQDDDNGARV